MAIVSCQKNFSSFSMFHSPHRRGFGRGKCMRIFDKQQQLYGHVYCYAVYHNLDNLAHFYDYSYTKSSPNPSNYRVGMTRDVIRMRSR